jgi:hypothetical protein
VEDHQGRELAAGGVGFAVDAACVIVVEVADGGGLLAAE